MRPVNLIPPEDRRGDRAPLRKGPIAYVIVGGLAAALLAITGLVLTGNSITEKKSELAALEVREEAASLQAGQLAPYIDFATMQADRETTLASLADSRFDWERVLRELSLVNPTDVWLTELVGTASGGSGESSTTSTISAGTSAPSLSISGCAVDHVAVARFIAALEDIDGVTRVGLSSTARPIAGSTEEGGGEAVTEGCISAGRPATFSATAVFDEAPVAPAAGESTTVATEGASSTTPPGAQNLTETGESAGGQGGKGGKKKQQPEEALEGAAP